MSIEGSRNQIKIPKIILPILAGLIYIVFFILMHEIMGLGLIVLAIFPVALTGWLYGIGWGLAAAVLATLINVLLFHLTGMKLDLSDDFIRLIMALFTLILAGIGAGILHWHNNKINSRMAEQTKNLLEMEKQRNVNLSRLREATLAISKPNEISALYQMVVREAVQLVNADGGSFYTKTKDNQLVCKVNLNNEHNSVGSLKKFGDEEVDIVAKTGKPLSMDDCGKWDQKPESSADFNNKSFTTLSMPIIWQESICGVLEVFRLSKSSKFSDVERQLLALFSNHVAGRLENARLLEEVKELARLDPLTNLLNRRGFYDLAARELDIARRYKHSIALLFLDIDHFKNVNDQYGHSVGDEVLVELASRCKAILRSSDLFCRYGGEEFLILLMENDINHAQEVAQRLNSVVKTHPFQTSAGEVSITISIGMAEFRGQTQSLELFIDQADTALYQAKTAGRDRVVMYHQQSPAMH